MKTVTRFIAKDGKSFSCRKECLKYERRRRESVMVYEIADEDIEDWGDCFRTDSIGLAIDHLRELMERMSRSHGAEEDYFAINKCLHHPSDGDIVS